MPSAQEVQMQVIHRLPTIVTGIDYDAVSTVKPYAARYFRSFRHHVAQKRSMLLLGMGRGRNMLLRDDQHVRRSLRIDVRKTKALVVFV